MAIYTLVNHIKTRLFRFLVSSLLLLPSAAALAQTASDFLASPPIISSTSKPLVMLALSNDHQLFFKSYSDYDDLDNDGTPEITYTHSIDYVGYFDPYKCYSYSSDRFNPDNVTADKYCTTGQWSGNFLNWATMTRIDQIRKVLYGGFRRTDTSILTVLERSFLTTDAHSFAKYYDGTDVEKLTPYNPPVQGAGTNTSGITFCNTTYTSSGKSENIDTSTVAPLLRIVYGNYSLWAGGEKTQCRFTNEGGDVNKNNVSISGIQAYASSPNVSARIADLKVRVSVCVSVLEEENCVKYPTSTHKKPTGFLQDYGDNEQMYFGLMSGSYFKNKSGGVLRKNVGSFTDEVNVLTDGTFKAAPATGGIVSTIDAFRITGYNFGNKGYGGDSCDFNKGTFVNGECKSWGNPFAEIMLECYRYFAEGTSANPNFASADSGLISALKTQTWANPMTEETSCGEISIIAFNASTTSYDGDELSGVSDLQNGGKSAKTLTDEVGALEGINGNSYYVGRVDGAGNTLCSAKTVSTLGGVDGTCPDSPRLEGTHKLAGLAYHVFKTDIRPDLPGKQLVNTYGVSLAPAVPAAVLPVPNTNKTVEVLPACNNTRKPDNGDIEGNCALVEFKILQLPTEAAGVVTAKYYVNWESASQGGDFDQDLWGIIEVSVTQTKVKVTTNAVAESTGAPMGFGYVISGTNQDGFHAHSGIEGYDYQFNGEDECNNCQVGNSATWQEYTIGNSTASLLEDPLFYAAKYGNFRDSDGDGKPNTVDEWDVKDTNGNIGSDGIPDNYFPITNPLQLTASIKQVLDAIDVSLVSSSAAAVVANSSSGTGAIYQGLYYPEYKASNTDNVNWVGMMQAIFIDENGYLREDSAQKDDEKGRLDGYDKDYRIEIYYDEVFERSRIQRYKLADNADITEIDDNDFVKMDQIEIEDFQPIWNARNELAKLDNDTQIKTQRHYENLANTGRYMFTGIDTDSVDADGIVVDKNGLVEHSETFPFDDTNFPDDGSGNNYRYLGLDSSNYASASDIVNFIRGYEGISGYRTRAVDYDGDGTEEKWRLGDFIHSEPVSVSRPNANYDVRYGDESYRAFRQQYAHRRQVVYVGGNDGMLHAFNAGFYNTKTRSFDTAKPDDSNATEHPLGSELWAYVPMNLLPHLRWLTAPDYQHIYYVDGSPRVYDVNIFDKNDQNHPGGWGTILVVGMRLGGGEITLDPNSDDDGSDTDTDDITTRSAFIVMDITNPEKPPELIAEIAYEGMGFTTSKPVVVKRRKASDSGSFNSPTKNQWLLVMGSGPTGDDALSKVVSDQNAKVVMFDLDTKEFVDGFRPDPDVNGSNLDNTLYSHPASYTGNLAAVDWNNDYTDDAIYFGIVAESPATPDGALKRLGLNFDSPESSPLTTLLDTDAPIVDTPRMEKDELGSQWVYAGTGRYLASSDNSSTARQYFYGVIENDDGSTVVKSKMVDVTDFQVFTADPNSYLTANFVKECEYPCTNGGSDITIEYIENGSSVAYPIASWQDLRWAISKTNGWYREFNLQEVVTGTSAGRSFGPTNILGTTLLFVEYAPSTNQCAPIGYSRLFGVNYQTGTASPYANAGYSGDYNGYYLAETNFGALSNQIQLGGDGQGDADNNNGDGILQSGDGSIDDSGVGGGGTPPSTRRSWKEITIDWNIGL